MLRRARAWLSRLRPRDLEVSYAYAVFCDENHLQRIDATPERHAENINEMIRALERKRARLRRGS